MKFNLKKLIRDLIDPKKDDKVIIAIDEPHREEDDNKEWKERRKWAEEWKKAFEIFECDILGLIKYKATMRNNAPLPERALLYEKEVNLVETLERATIIMALTQYSATAPLSFIAKKTGARGASMPKISKRMEKTALSADYNEISEKAKKIEDVLKESVVANISFSTGHKLKMDLRKNKPQASDGKALRGEIHNLPGGETFTVPYEGEDSETEGEMPLEDGIFTIKHNKIIKTTSKKWNENFFKENPTRRNIAELGVGCNPKAKITGVVLEDEKAEGIHIAFGTSKHLGGRVLSDVHLDTVYSKDSKIKATMILKQKNGKKITLVENSRLKV